MWAPIIDRIQIPFLTKKLGHRRGWIVLMQIAILISLVVWSFINPTENLALLITVGLIIAIASATQDITVDALRIEQINENEGKSMAAGAAMAVVGWWTGYKLGGVVSLNTAEFNATTPPSLYPVHHPTTAIAAPACIDSPSFFPICSILKASTVIS